MSPPPDPLLWRRAVAGDTDAFGVLYERHDRAVLAFCLWRTGDPALAEDLTSIVFLEAWRRRASTPLTTGDARPLLLAIATNVLRNQWRTRRRHRAALERLGRAGEPRPDHDDDAADRVDAAARLHEVRAQLDALPQREREVLALVALADLTYEETASALGLPVGTVRSRLSRARARLAAGPLPTDVRPTLRPTTKETSS
ncbi:RNA polymerase sigma factor [Patulibacter sp. NPDC049589]|uniref:RNA polymerase sigma factor n=1 Tax=Patulibacter sp. NPDC049589 TaxID=3154731 RepID=UPI003440E69C